MNMFLWVEKLKHLGFKHVASGRYINDPVVVTVGYSGFVWLSCSMRTNEIHLEANQTTLDIISLLLPMAVDEQVVFINSLPK